jgi:DNA-binding GntR family transcriptional regulator
VVGNHLAQHRELSATAIGLAVHIQSLPDGAPVTVKALAARFSEGETRIARALNELVRAGYLVRTRTRDTTGRITTRTLFKEHPGATQPPERNPSTHREPRTPTPPR